MAKASGTTPYKCSVERLDVLRDSDYGEKIVKFSLGVPILYR